MKRGKLILKEERRNHSIPFQHLLMQEGLLQVPINLNQPVYLKVEMVDDYFTFYYGNIKDSWIKIGSKYDATIISDERVREGSERYLPAFTGGFFGIACQDLAGTKQFADFKWMEYEEL